MAQIGQIFDSRLSIPNSRFQIGDFGLIWNLELGIWNQSNSCAFDHNQNKTYNALVTIIAHGGELDSTGVKKQ